MWLQTSFGFFSIVQKRGDAGSGTLTVRARSAADLDRLRERFLPELEPTVAGAGTDYAYRARAPRAAVARAAASMLEAIDYDNFKSAVGKTDRARAALYGEVWSVLARIDDSAPGGKIGKR